MITRVLLAVIALVLQSAVMPVTADAHQPVILNATDTTAAKGPLLTDGTISFAVRASFSKAGERRGFRAAFKSGDQFSLQYLILDKKPENSLRTSALPNVLITSPSGRTINMKISEKTRFFEPFTQTNYLYLARTSFAAEVGNYAISIISRGRAEITIAIGDKEIPGEVLRGPLSTLKATPTTSPSATTTPTPKPSTTTKATSYTLEMVKQNNSEKSCWSIIDGYVYDLTKWINSHPGGAGAIRSLCGVDGTAAFKAQHLNQYKPEQRLESFQLGPLSRP